MPYLAARAEVFRFNSDLWREYSWNIHSTGYELRDPSGRCCREEEVGAVYERKVWFEPRFIDVPAGGSQENWLRTEVMEIWSGIKDLAVGAGKMALIHPSPGGVWKKIRQMRVAAKYFPVPDWQMLHMYQPDLGDAVVCKSNGGASVGNFQIFNVRKVAPEMLDTSYPWFLQKAVQEAEEDVTVAWIAGKMFASSLRRDAFKGMDSRVVNSVNAQGWQPAELSRDEQSRITELMKETGLSFARLDFLRTPQGLVFLELNPNGQFVWMDLHDERGMLSSIADEIMRIHSLHIP